MPPRKRKAQKPLVAPEPVQEVSDEEKDIQVETTIEECTEQVEAKADYIIQYGRQRAQLLRSESTLFLTKLSKQIRQMSLAHFFKLSPDEAAAKGLQGLPQRLGPLQQGRDGQQTASAGEDATAAPAASYPHTAPEASLQVVGAAQTQPTRSQAVPCTSVAATGTASTVPPLQPRPALAKFNARPPQQNEVLYSVNGSPICIEGALLANTGNQNSGLTDPTPAVGVVAPQSMAFTGRTFRRAMTTTRGRAKQDARTITVTTADGKQFTVDDVVGLTAVPEQYREEVQRLVESDLRDLESLVQTVTTMEQQNAAAATKPAAGRPTRRRQ